MPLRAPRPWPAVNPAVLMLEPERCKAAEVSNDPGGHALHECRFLFLHSGTHRCRMCEHSWREGRDRKPGGSR